jgi:hypothetical protein
MVEELSSAIQDALTISTPKRRPICIQHEIAWKNKRNSGKSPVVSLLKLLSTELFCRNNDKWMDMLEYLDMEDLSL